MIYVFTFLGEFGYELFNWQGLVRRFKSTCSVSDKIVVAGRTGMDIWYPYADAFIDISQNNFFKSSRADCYFAYDLNSPYVNEYLDELKASLREGIDALLPNLNFYGNNNSRVEYIFSSDKNKLNGIYFGNWPNFFSIYGGEGHKQNLYAKIDYDSEELRKKIEDDLNMKLTEPYVLFQSRKREIVIRSVYKVPIETLIKKVAEKTNVVILNFDTGRAWDSKSEFSEMSGCKIFTVSSAHEQAILIRYAAACVFSTENDFGSHIYVPPFMGKDVLAIAGADVYKIGTTPIKFWNDNIFKFGGKIIPFVSEEIFESEKNLEEFCRILLSRISLKTFFTDVENKGKNSKFEDFLSLAEYSPAPAFSPR